MSRHDGERRPVELTPDERLSASVVLTWAAERLEANAEEINAGIIAGGGVGLAEEAAMVAGLREQAAMARRVAYLLARGLS